MLREVFRPIRTAQVLTQRLDASDSLRKALPVAALFIGAIWAVSLGFQLGVQEGGDTQNYIRSARLLSARGLSAQSLFGGGSLGNLLYHMTHFWIFLLGNDGFVAFAAALTALVPFFVVKILQHNAVHTLIVLVALFYVAVNREIYSWAFYVLGAALLHPHIVLFLYLITFRRYSWYHLSVIPIVWYSTLFMRATAIILIPATIIFATLGEHPKKKYFLFGLMVATLVFILAFTLRSPLTPSHPAQSPARQPADIEPRGGQISDRGQYAIFGNVLTIARKHFVAGELLNDPTMTEYLSVPFTKEEAEGKSLGELCRSHKGYCGHYFFRKALAFFLPVFPKFSTKHKIFNGLYFGSMLLLSAVGFIWLFAATARAGWRSLLQERREHFATYLLCGLLLPLAATMHLLSAVDPDAQYVMTWTPAWILFNAFQLNFLLELSRESRKTQAAAASLKA
ncbi:MAG: hypothetical protein ACE5JS_04100 [Nitrospinota bacterium]